MRNPKKIEPLYISFFKDLKFKLITSEDDQTCVLDLDIAVSGSGKTFRLYNIACFGNIFIIFINAYIGDTIMSSSEICDTLDQSFHAYYEKITKSFECIDEVETYSHLFILTRILYLGILLKINPEMKPKDFLLLQLNGSTTNIKNIFDYLCETHFYNKSIIKDLITIYFTKILKERCKNIKIGVAIDEASGLIQCMRGLVAPFENALSSLLYLVNYITHSGTSFTIKDGKQILSSIGKEKTDFYNEFPFFKSIKEVEDYLNLFLNLKGCEKILKDKKIMKKLIGRKRIASLAIKELSRIIISNDEKIECTDEKKCEILKESIESAYHIMKDQMIKRINSHLERNNKDETLSTEEKFKKTNTFTDALKKLVSLSIMSCESLIELNYIEEDIMDLGITNINIINEKLYQIHELLAYDVAFHYIPNYGEQEIINELTHCLNFNPKGQEKGYPFERFIFLQFKKLKNRKISELSFIKNPETWMNNIDFEVNKFGTYQELGFQSDLEVISFMLKENQNIILKPENNMGPDGLWISKMNNNIYIIVFAIKFYTKYCSKAQTKNQIQSNLGHCYLNEHGNIIKGQEENYSKFHDLFRGQLKNYYQKEEKNLRSKKRKIEKEEMREVMREEIDEKIEEINEKEEQIEETDKKNKKIRILRIHIQTPYPKSEHLQTQKFEYICNIGLNELSEMIDDSKLFNFIQSICSE